MNQKGFSSFIFIFFWHRIYSLENTTNSQWWWWWWWWSIHDNNRQWFILRYRIFFFVFRKKSCKCKSCLCVVVVVVDKSYHGMEWIFQSIIVIYFQCSKKKSIDNEEKKISVNRFCFRKYTNNKIKQSSSWIMDHWILTFFFGYWFSKE